LKLGIDSNFITGEESVRIFDAIPSMAKIPAYITGFVDSRIEYDNLPYGGRRTPTKFIIETWNGRIQAGDMGRIALAEGIRDVVKVEFEQIQKFSHESGYLFNTGSLIWSREEWRKRMALI
jgi:hypothetical protein